MDTPPLPSLASPSAPPAAGAFLASLERLTRSGFCSSEFWLVVCAIGLFAVDSAAGELPPKWMASLSALLVLGYKYFRVAVKQEGAQRVVELADGVLAAGGVRAAGSEGGLR